MAFQYGEYVFNGGGTQFDDLAFFWNGGGDTNPTTSPNTTPSWHQDNTGGGSTNGAANSGVDSDGFCYVETSGSPASGQTGEIELDVTVDASTQDIFVDFWTNGGDVSNRCIWRVQTNENSAGWVTRYTFTYNGTNNEAADVWTEHNVDLTGLISNASTRIRIQIELAQSGGAGLYELDPAVDSVTFTGVDQATATGMQMATADTAQATAGAENPGAFTFEDSLPWGAITLALRRASASSTSNLSIGSKFTQIVTPTMTVQDGATIDGLTIDGDVVLDDVTDLDNVLITGDLTINTAGTYDFSDVIVGGDITNDDGSGNVTINASGNSTLSTSEPGTGNGQVNILNTVTVTVTARDASDSGPIEDARVYLEADSGGPLSAGTVILNTLTNASGIAQDTAFNFSSNQPVVGRIRKGSSPPLYKTTPITGTITANGLDVTGFMVGDN